ncbi:hypothetical protein ACS0PU_008115 [Formica fusca]|uniref:uncharacterized protein LOC115239206 n=1 Tax=Formica exsecta TaxID=72781 RepID=UPI001141744C|nr:uncharacterized protein LOC115239206 [Formica exsecta]XP_029669460.1 uncharacterized protein LOC115239206 [Formica exsecta]
MALMLTLPLIGLDPEHFSALNVKLLKLENEQNSRNSPDSGRASPSTGSETSGISSLALSGESASAELTPVSSRPETPTKVPYKEKINAPPLRIMHGGRDILNLGANIRPSFNWEITDRKLSRYEIQNIIANRSVRYRLREQPLNDYSMKCCDECGFCEQPCVF